MELIYKCPDGHSFTVSSNTADDPTELAWAPHIREIIDLGCHKVIAGKCCGKQLHIGGIVSTVFYWRVLGGHVHVRVFSGPKGFTRGKNGDLIFTLEEWVSFRENHLPESEADSVAIFREMVSFVQDKPL